MAEKIGCDKAADWNRVGSKFPAQRVYQPVLFVAFASDGVTTPAAASSTFSVA